MNLSCQKPVSRNTSKTYVKAYGQFKKFVDEHGFAHNFPPRRRVVLAWLTSLAVAGKSPSTVKVSLQALIYICAERGKEMKYEDKRALNNSILQYQRELAEKGAPPPPPMGPPMTAKVVGSLLRVIDEKEQKERDADRKIAACRDAAAVATLWSGALRGSELVNIRLSDVHCGGNRVKILIRKSKGDQIGAGETIYIEDYSHLFKCKGAPSRIKELVDNRPPAWGDNDYLFGSPSVSWLEKSMRKWRKGGDVKFTSHSFRIGFATEMGGRNINLAKLQKHMRHKDIKTTMRYVKLTAEQASSEIHSSTFEELEETA